MGPRVFEELHGCLQQRQEIGKLFMKVFPLLSFTIIIIHCHHHHHLMNLDDERSIHRRILATGHLGTSHSPSREHPHISS